MYICDYGEEREGEEGGRGGRERGREGEGGREREGEGGRERGRERRSKDEENINDKLHT